MTSKKPAQQKRANLPRGSDRTKQFRKDWERLTHSRRYDVRRLKEAMLLLIANDGLLPRERYYVSAWRVWRSSSALSRSRAREGG